MSKTGIWLQNNRCAGWLAAAFILSGPFSSSALAAEPPLDPDYWCSETIAIDPQSTWALNSANFSQWLTSINASYCVPATPLVVVPDHVHGIAPVINEGNPRDALNLSLSEKNQNSNSRPSGG